MARTTGESSTTPSRSVKATRPPRETTQEPGSSDRYVVPLVHFGVPGTWVHFGATRDQASRDHYVVPLAHVQVPANWVDYGIWTAAGVAVATEGITLPLAVAGGALLRRLSRPPRP